MPEIVEQNGSDPAEHNQYFHKRNFGAAAAVFEDDRHENWTLLQHRIAYVVESNAADAIMGLLISINAMLVVLETNYKGLGEDLPTWLNVCTTALIIIYSLELIARMVLYRQFFFCSSWNLFDFFVVGTDIITELIGRLFGSVLPSVSVLRIFRILRLLRFVQFLTVFAELHMMVRLMISSLRTMFWGTVLLVVTVTLWSIIAVEFLHPLIKDLAKQGKYDDCERCARAFETVYQANLTFFQQLIFGDSWGQISNVLIEAHPWTSFILVAAGVTLQVGLLNLILTVIVDKAHEQHENDQAAKLKVKERMFMKAKDKLIEICGSIDQDGSGELEIDELMKGFETNHDFAVQLATLDIKAEDMQIVFNILDEDQSGTVTYIEFVDQLYKMRAQDTNTMLLFIKGYLNDLRNKVNKNVTALKTQSSKLDEISERQVAFPAAPPLAEKVVEPILSNPQTPGLEMFQKDIEMCTQKLNHVAERLEEQVADTFQQLQISIRHLSEVTLIEEPAPTRTFFQSCEVAKSQRKPAKLAPTPPRSAPTTVGNMRTPRIVSSAQASPPNGSVPNPQNLPSNSRTPNGFAGR